MKILVQGKDPAEETRVISCGECGSVVEVARKELREMTLYPTGQKVYHFDCPTCCQSKDLTPAEWEALPKDYSQAAWSIYVPGTR